MVRIVKKPEERKSEIIEAASHLFLSKGYDKTTMQDVMKEVQIAKGTIYHYFKSKDDLLEAVITSIAKQDQARCRDLVSGLQGSALDKIKILATSGTADNNDPEVIQELHKPGNAGMHIRLIAKLVTLQAEIYAEVIKEGCDEGVFSTDHPLECAEFILSAISFMTDFGIYPWSEDQMRRRILAIPNLVEKLTGAQENSFQFLLGLIPEN